MWSTFVLTGNLEPIYGIKQGSDRFVSKGHIFLLVKTQKDLASEMGVSVDTLQNYKKLKVLLAANFGRKKNSEAKKRKIAAEYVKLCGYKKGGDRSSKGQHGLLTIKEIATQLGTSERSLKRALRIENKLTDSMKQRGDVGGSAKKVGMRIKELERIYGIKNGGSGYYGNQHEELLNNFKAPKTQEQLASDLGITVQTLQNYKKLTEMVPELEDLVDTGIVSNTTALAVVR